MGATQSREIVLIGASNAARGLGYAIAELRARSPSPPRILAALGRGRSFGLSSSVLGRRLPSVLECGLWNAISAPTHALICDVGNDLAYGVEPERVVGWVRETALRLSSAKLAIVALPVARLRTTPNWRLRLVARAIFPTRSFDFESLLDSVERVDRELAELARELGATRVDVDPRWYGLDPIHFASWKSREVWNRLCAPFGDRVREPNSNFISRASCELLVPERRRLLGFEQRGAQPCRRFADGGELSLF